MVLTRKRKSPNQSHSITPPPQGQSHPTTAGQPYHLPFKNQNSTFINRQFFLCHAVGDKSADRAGSALPLPIKNQNSTFINRQFFLCHAVGDKSADRGGSALPLPFKNQNSTFINRQFFLCHAVSSRCSATFIQARQPHLFASDDVNAVWIDP
jgi:hypothetical protein